MSASFERGVDAIRQAIDAPIASYFASCVHCGLCADACLFYTETGDPRYTPINKVEPMKRIWRQEFTLLGRITRLLGLVQPVTDEELAEWSRLTYDACSMCGRCSLVCPVGNDITYMIRKFREGLSLAGHAPPGVIDATRRTIELGSPMGVKLQTLMAQIKRQEAETGLEIPLDKVGADYLALLSSMEIVNYPEYLGALARVFHQAGVSWTLSTDAYEATNSGIQIGQSDLAAKVVQRIVDAAEKLGVKTVISPECGHAFMALRFEGPNLIGRRYKFDVVHILELLDQLRADGRIRFKGRDPRPLTYHDPCQIARRGGVIDPPRRLLGEIAENFQEMHETGKWNWCCGGGGGVSANDRAEELKLKSFKVKKRQLDELEVTTVVTSCANCRITFEEALEHYNMPVEVIGLAEMVADHLDAEEVNND